MKTRLLGHRGLRCRLLRGLASYAALPTTARALTVGVMLSAAARAQVGCVAAYSRLADSP